MFFSFITKQVDILTDRQTDRQTYRQTDRQTGRQTDRQTDRKTGRDRQSDRETNRQVNRQKDRSDVTKFYNTNSNDANVITAELQLNKTRPTFFYKKHNLL